MKKAAVFLADGFEEIEALSVVDILRRAEIETDMISVSSNVFVTGRSNIEVRADFLFDDMDFSSYDSVILPGGMPGTTNLMHHNELCNLVEDFNNRKKAVCAICAAPTILAQLGILKGRKACCYPGCEEGFNDVNWVNEGVCVDENIITSQSAATAIDFALTIVRELLGNEKALEIAESIVYAAQGK